MISVEVAWRPQLLRVAVAGVQLSARREVRAKRERRLGTMLQNAIGTTMSCTSIVRVVQ